MYVISVRFIDGSELWRVMSMEEFNYADFNTKFGDPSQILSTTIRWFGMYEWRDAVIRLHANDN